MKTESHGEICQRVIYYTYKIYYKATSSLRAKCNINKIPFKISVGIDEEKLKKLPKNEQEYFLDFIKDQRTPLNETFPQNEKEIDLQFQAFKDLADDF
ncbi:hypothetical protein ACLH3R_002332 [Flavobacterium psychrophilum]